jgi:TPP-dependent pyruvate/acetoin dehydrogenase alpha subunit
MNLAAVWSLPVVYVCENNGWAELTPMQKVTARGAIVHRAGGYGIPGVTVDGNDVFAVHEVVTEAVDRARRGDGPTLIEAITYRIREHAEGIDRIFGKASTEEQLAEWGSRDPIARVRAALTEMGVDVATLDAVDEEIAAEIDAAVEFAMASPVPAPETALEDMWTPAPGGVA